MQENTHQKQGTGQDSEHMVNHAGRLAIRVPQTSRPHGQRMSDPLWHHDPMKNRNRSSEKPQLDLGLPSDPGIAPNRTRRTPRPCSRERAEWWFRQMYRAIEGATAS